MPRKRTYTSTAADQYLAGPNKDPTSPSFVKRKANLGRLVKASPTFPVKPEAVEEALYRFTDVVPVLPPDEGEIDDQIRVTLGDPDDYASSTRRQRYIVLNQFFGSKIGRGLGLAHLLEDIPIPAKGEPRIVVLTAEEVDALIDAVETEQERALVYLLLHTGIRIGEVEGMKVAHIVDGELTVDGKQGPRPVTLQPEMERILRELANEAGDIWWDDNGPLSLGQLEYRYHKIAKRAGIRHQGPHALRHTFATMWLRNGGGLGELQCHARV